MGNEVWNEYKKISIVRNPWDHAVSWFKWQEKYGYEGTQKDEFKTYLLNNYRSTWPFYTIKYGHFDMDFIIRFENLNEDTDLLLDYLNIQQGLNLPKTKGDIRKKKDYKDLYETDFMIDLVYEKAFCVIDKFNYKFK